MSDEIKFISIEIQNYRQYYGSHKIQFASREEGFTVIFGKNGEGKSNLLNAINWCLYKFEPHGIGEDISGHKSENRSLPIINTRYITEIKEETRADLKVDIWIQKGDTVYSITRTLGILKHKLETRKLSSGREEILLFDNEGDNIPKGCEKMNEPFTTFVITKKGPHDSDFTDTIRWGRPENIMKEILPTPLSRYFLLDGEFLEGFWKTGKNIRDGIEQISQLHLISGTIQHIKSLMSIPSKGFSKDTDDLTSKLKQFDRFENSKDEDGNEKFTDEERYKEDPSEDSQYYHSTGNPRIHDLGDDIDRMNNKLTSISEEIRKLNGVGLDKLKEEYAKLDSEVNGLKDQYINAGNTFLFNLIKKGPQIMLKNAIQESIDIIDKEIDLGGLPVKYKRIFAESLLDSERCVCHETLGQKDPRRKYVEEFKKSLVGKEDKDEAAVLGYDFKKYFLNDYEKFCEINFVVPRKNYSDLQNEYDIKDKELSGIKTQIANKGGDDAEKLINEQKYLLERINKLHEWKSKSKSDLEINNNERGKTKVKLDTALKSNSKAYKVAHELKIWDKISEDLEKIYDELKEEIRNSIQTATWKNYKALLSNPSEFISFEIEPDYTVHLMGKDNFNKVRNLSAGQSLLLTLSFVAAIREPTGYKFPLVIDSPAGKIDGPNSHNIGVCLPEFLPNVQLTLLVTNKEYTDYISPDPDFPNLPNTPVCKLLEEKINVQHFKIQKDKDLKSANVGNSVILPGKLTFTDDPEKNIKGWMVVADE